MKRQLFAISLAAISTMSGVAIIPSAQAQTSQEIEPNDQQAANTLTVSTSGATVVTGRFSNATDFVDTYKVILSSGTGKMQVSAGVNGSPALIQVVQDNNKNGQFESTDRVLQEQRGSGSVVFSQLPVSSSNQYLVRLVQNPSVGSTYTLVAVGAAQTIGREMRVNIVSAKALTQFDPSNPLGNSERADFFTRVTTGSRTLIGTTRKIDNNNAPEFNELLRRQIDVSIPQASQIPIEITLNDSDGVSDNDIGDISPTGDRILKLTYDSVQGVVKGPSGETLGQRGQRITMRGNSSSNNAEIIFSVDHAAR
jgi:hypothetical protein